MLDGFEEFEELEVKEKPDNVKEDKGNFNKKSKFKKKSGINLFKENPRTRELVLDSLKTSKSFLFILNNKNEELSNEFKDYLKKLFNILKDKGFKIRIICETVNSAWDIITEIFDEEEIFIFKPWNKYCDSGSYIAITPTDIAIEIAANYTKNFNKLPTGIKYIKSATYNALFGKNMNSPVSFVLLYDPNYDGKKIPFDKSKESSGLLWTLFELKDTYNFAVYNLANKDDRSNLVNLLKNNNQQG